MPQRIEVGVAPKMPAPKEKGAYDQAKDAVLNNRETGSTGRRLADSRCRHCARTERSTGRGGAELPPRKNRNYSHSENQSAIWRTLTVGAEPLGKAHELLSRITSTSNAGESYGSAGGAHNSAATIRQMWPCPRKRTASPQHKHEVLEPNSPKD